MVSIFVFLCILTGSNSANLTTVSQSGNETVSEVAPLVGKGRLITTQSIMGISLRQKQKSSFVMPTPDHACPSNNQESIYSINDIVGCVCTIHSNIGHAHYSVSYSMSFVLTIVQYYGISSTEANFTELVLSKSLLMYPPTTIRFSWLSGMTAAIQSLRSVPMWLVMTSQESVTGLYVHVNG